MAGVRNLPENRNKHMNAKYMRRHRERMRELKEKMGIIKIKKLPKTPAERSRRYRQRKRETALLLKHTDTSIFEMDKPEGHMYGIVRCNSDYPLITKEIITVPDFITDQPESYCRFCCSSNNLSSIFPTAGAPEESIINLLRELIDISLSVELDFPSAICGHCSSKLQTFDEFRRKCQAYHDEMRRRRAQQELCMLTNVKNEVLSDCEDKIGYPVVVKEEFIIEDAPSSCTINNDVFVQKKIATVDELSCFGARIEQIKIAEKCDDDEQHALSMAVNTKKKVFDIEGNNEVMVMVKEEPITTNECDVNSTNNNFLFKPVIFGKEDSLERNRTKTKSTSKKPKKNDDEKRDFRCKLCGKFYTSKERIDFHMEKHIDSKSRRCRNCLKSFESVHGLRIHARRSYTLKSFPCQYCDVLFPSKGELLAHESCCDKSDYENKAESFSDPSKSIKCTVCWKTCYTPRGLLAHMRLHEAKFQCDSCGVDLPSPSLLKAHYDRYHAGGAKLIASTVKCEPCQRTFIDASAYRSHHTRFHDNQQNNVSRKLDERKPYECHHCGKRFWSINTIRYHVLVHRIYRDCDQCSDSFRTKTELRSHKLTTHPVYCEFCSKPFFSEKARRSHCNKQHGMVHVRQLVNDGCNVIKISYTWRKITYRCALCDQDFGQFRQLSDHFGKRHPGAKVKIRCTYCNKDSVSQIGFIGHVTRNCGQTPKKMR
ncbi:zinc finger protein 112-like [Wyeomyia smithii]|uniref:zinc finger protein 112-like n=1 Tax=Wyeomyia smithii TaxID=174621 RepID=UPI002467E1E8|nr:zinc finger protein 112-like [Wyeomyia smithii]